MPYMIAVSLEMSDEPYFFHTHQLLSSVCYCLLSVSTFGNGTTYDDGNIL